MSLNDPLRNTFMLQMALDKELMCETKRSSEAMAVGYLITYSLFRWRSASKEKAP